MYGVKKHVDSKIQETDDYGRDCAARRHKTKHKKPKVAKLLYSFLSASTKSTEEKVKGRNDSSKTHSIRKVAAAVYLRDNSKCCLLGHSRHFVWQKQGYYIYSHFGPSGLDTRTTACSGRRSYQVEFIYNHRTKRLILTRFSAIDNATRGLISQEQLPVTCGLFFSLGHSTIVLAVTIAIAISSGIYDRMQKVGDVGGIIGASISGSFLFVIGLANTIVLWQIIGRRRRDKIFERRHAEGESVPNVERDVDHPESRTLMMRILGPIVTFVNRPWKMYPVGFLFGLGFDTASSVALLSVSALGKRDANGAPIPSSHIIILPLLFTAGMTLIDTSDSILMLYSYSGIHEKTWKIFTSSRIDGRVISDTVTSRSQEKNEVGLSHTIEGLPSIQEPTFASTKAKMNVMSELSIILTLMSILVAFAISLITIMGLIGENCRRCVEAADADERHGGLAGRWWRAWASASDVSEYIGAAIVGVFVLVVLSWYGGRWALKRFAK